MLDGGALGTGDDAAASNLGVDGTTGQICTSDKDCVSATGPGVNVCSIGVAGTVGNVDIQFWSTPVCLIPPTTANCDPAPIGKAPGPHYCDGPDNIASPGICVADDQANPQPGQGLCFPKCSYTLGGTATGCAGSNVCSLDWFSPPTASSSAVTGVGFCQSTCQVDSDCSKLGAGYGCQTDIGLCTTKKVTRAKPIGSGCVASTDGGADDNTTGACNCLSGSSGQGVCTSFCVVGGAACPNGWVCETDETSSPFPGTTVTVSTQTRGVSGFCVPACSLTDAGAAAAGTGDAGEADAAPDAGGTPAGQGCPVGTSCQGKTLAGPDCQP